MQALADLISDNIIDFITLQETKQEKMVMVS
jgi:hypothetical protein